MSVSLTIKQKTNISGFPKAAELIEITGASQLEAPDRAILNKLLEYAHDAGNIADPNAEWQLPLASLRQGHKHESNDRVRQSLRNLMKIEVAVHYKTDSGELRELRTHLIEYVDISSGNEIGANVRFGIPKKLGVILEVSQRWGRIKSEVTFAMSSRYAIALYELLCLRANLDRCLEVFSTDRFRELLGVPPDTYKKGDDFRRFVIAPALLEVNGLSDLSVQIDLRRRHSRAPIHEVVMAWSKKQGDEYRASMRELNNSKLGRKARLRGNVVETSNFEEDASNMLLDRSR